MKNVNVYATVIGILMNEDIDYRAVVVKLAQEHPGTFLKVCGVQVEKPQPLPEQWVIDAVNYLPDNLVQSIKTVRAATGLGLKDAKDVVDNVAQRLGVRNVSYPPHAMSAHGTDADRQQNAYKAMLKHALSLTAVRFPFALDRNAV